MSHKTPARKSNLTSSDAIKSSTLSLVNANASQKVVAGGTVTAPTTQYPHVPVSRIHVNPSWLSSVFAAQAGR